MSQPDSEWIGISFSSDEPVDFAEDLSESEQTIRRSIANAYITIDALALDPIATAEVTKLRERFRQVLLLYFPFHRSDGDDPAYPESVNAFRYLAEDSVARLILIVSGLDGRESIPAELAIESIVKLDDWVQSLTRHRASGEEPKLRSFVFAYQRIAKQDPLGYIYRLMVGDRQRLEEAVGQAERFAEEARLAAGDAGERALITNFDAHAESEGRKAWLLVVGAMVPLLVAVLIAWATLKDAHDLPTGLIVGRLSVTLPLIGFAAYLGKLSSHFREASRWASTARTQLQTIGAFAATIENAADRDEVRKVLGRRVFSSPDFGESSQPADATATLQAAADIVAKLRG